MTDVVAILQNATVPAVPMSGVAPVGPKGDPGGNVMAIGLFADGATLSIPVGTDVVRTSGHTVPGLGIADYVEDLAVDAAYVTANPRTSFMSANSRGFRLVFNGIIDVAAVGALGDGVSDDTDALQASIDFLASNGGGTVNFDGRVYIVDGDLQDTSYSNSQLVLPKVTDIAAGVVIHFIGPTGAGTTFSSESGAILKSTLGAGNGAMIGCQTSSGVSRISFYAENLTFRMVENPTNSCLDLRYIPMAQLRNVRVDVPDVAIAGPTGAFDVAEPTTATSYGIKTALQNIPTWCNLDNVVIVGFYTGLKSGELVQGNNVAMFACKRALEVGDSAHPSVFGRILVCNCRAALVADPYLFINSEIHIQMLDIEHDETVAHGGSGPSWVEPIGYDIDDQYDSLRGVIWTHNHENSAPFTKNGARGLRIHHLRTGNSNDGPFTLVFPGISGVTEASAVREVRPRTPGAVLYDSLVGMQTDTSAAVGAWHVSNESAPGGDYRIGAIAVYQDGALTAGKMRLGTAHGGALRDQFEINNEGDLKLLQNTQHLTQASQGAIAGFVSSPSGTAFTFDWPRAFNNPPVVILTPLFDVGTVRYWYTGTASQCTINTSSAISGTWGYHVIGAPD